MSTSSFNTEEILTHLRSTYMSPDENIRKQAEKKLSEMKDQNFLGFSTQLIEILKSPTNIIDSNLKLSIISFLNKIIPEKIEKNDFPKDTRNTIIQLYLIIMVNPIMSNKEIDNLGETFTALLDTTVNEKNSVLIDIINYINSQLNSMSLGSVKGVITILSSILSSSALNKNIFYDVLKGILNMATKIVQNLYNNYIKLSPNDNSEDFFKLNSIFMNIFDLFFQCNFKKKKRYNKKNDDETITKLFDDCFIIGAKLLINQNATDNNRIISWTGNIKTDKNINKMKVSILRFLNIQINELDEFITDKSKVEFNDQLIKIILSNFEWVIMNKFLHILKIETEAEYDNNGYTLLISYMFIYLKRIFSKDNYINDYTEQLNKVYKNILLPLLIISDQEVEDALDNDSANDFCIDINDIIYENKQKKIKSTVSGLIKVIYEKNNNSNNFMLKYTLILLDIIIQNNLALINNSLFEKNDIMLLVLDKNLFNKEKVIYALFMTLNIFSDVKKYKSKSQNEELIKEFFEKSSNILYNPQNNCVYLTVQLIFFIRNYALKFYEPDSTGFENTLSYLFSNLLNVQNTLLSDSAADAIQEFFNQKNSDFSAIRYSLIKVAMNNIETIEKQILDIQILNFFDVLYQVISNLENENSEFFQKIFTNLCKRVSIEVERHYRLKFIVKKVKKDKKKKSPPQKDYNIVINKCFNIIRLLINNQRFVIKNTDLIETSLAPLVEYMKNPKKIEFDEDLVTIVYNMITTNKKITGIGYKLIQYLNGYVEKTGGILLDLYLLLNSYIVYGSDQILSNPNWVNGIFKTLATGLKSEKFPKSPFYVCNILIIWVIHCSKIPENYLNEIYELIIEVTNANYLFYNNNNSFEEPKINYLGYVCFIFCGLINYSNIIINLLQNKKKENNLKDWLSIISKINEVYFEYNNKLLVYSICKIIVNGIINGDIDSLLNSCVNILSNQEKNGKYELKKNIKKVFDLNFVEDDDDESKSNNNDDDDCYDYSDISEIKEMVKKTENPLKSIDEFKCFSELLSFLKNNKVDIYNKWENSLNDIERGEVFNLLKTKRITVEYKKNNYVYVPRRIVTIKRGQNNSNNMDANQ